MSPRLASFFSWLLASVSGSLPGSHRRPTTLWIHGRNSGAERSPEPTPTSRYWGPGTTAAGM